MTTTCSPISASRLRKRLRPLGAPLPDPDHPGDPRVDYDVPHEKPWGTDMVLYLFFKAVSTGVMLVAAALWLLHVRGSLVTVVAPAISIVSILLTAVVLIVDLERPERFHYILTKSNWRSWMVWGAWFLTVHGALSALWLIAGWLDRPPVLSLLAWPVVVVAVLATSYTGFLFAQGLARDLWQGHYATLDLIAQSGLAGSATLLVASTIAGHAAARPMLALILGASLVFHLADSDDRDPPGSEPHAPPTLRRRNDPSWAVRAVVLGNRRSRPEVFCRSRCCLAAPGRALTRPMWSSRRSLRWRAARHGSTSGSRPARACRSADTASAPDQTSAGKKGLSPFKEHVQRLEIASAPIRMGRVRRLRVDRMAQEGAAEVLDHPQRLLQLRIGVRDSGVRRPAIAERPQDRR